MGKKLTIGLIIIVIGLFALGRWSGGGSPQTATLSNLNNNLAPDFSLLKLDGSTISLSEFKGKKPLILYFFATWCPNCRRDMPKLSSYYEKYKDQVEVIGINLQENNKTVENFITSRHISFPIALDPFSKVNRIYGIRYTNTHILINKEGEIVRVIPGDIKESDIQSLIQ